VNKIRRMNRYIRVRTCSKTFLGCFPRKVHEWTALVQPFRWLLIGLSGKVTKKEVFGLSARSWRANARGVCSQYRKVHTWCTTVENATRSGPQQSNVLMVWDPLLEVKRSLPRRHCIIHVVALFLRKGTSENRPQELPSCGLPKLIGLGWLPLEKNSSSRTFYSLNFKDLTTYPLYLTLLFNLTEVPLNLKLDLAWNPTFPYDPSFENISRCVAERLPAQPPCITAAYN